MLSDVSTLNLFCLVSQEKINVAAVTLDILPSRTLAQTLTRHFSHLKAATNATPNSATAFPSTAGRPLHPGQAAISPTLFPIVAVLPLPSTSPRPPLSTARKTPAPSSLTPRYTRRSSSSFGSGRIARGKTRTTIPSLPPPQTRAQAVRPTAATGRRIRALSPGAWSEASWGSP